VAAKSLVRQRLGEDVGHVVVARHFDQLNGLLLLHLLLDVMILDFDVLSALVKGLALAKSMQALLSS